MKNQLLYHSLLNQKQKNLPLLQPHPPLTTSKVDAQAASWTGWKSAGASAPMAIADMMGR